MIIRVMDKNVDVVVARYQEDLSWLLPIADVCTVYNKSKMQVMPEGFGRVIQLENKGREADTYIKHIIRNYPEFPEYTIFTQGKVDDHVENVDMFVEYMRIISNGWVVPNGYEGYTYNGWNTIYNFNDYGLPLKDWWFKIFRDSPKDNKIVCNYCGVFGVSKERILFHDLEFYKEIDRMSEEAGDESAYILERFWTTIFNGETVGIHDMK